MQDHCFAFGEGLVTASGEGITWQEETRLAWIWLMSSTVSSSNLCCLLCYFLCSCDQDVCEHDLEKEMGFGGFSLWLFGYRYLGRKSWQWVSPPHG